MLFIGRIDEEGRVIQGINLDLVADYRIEHDVEDKKNKGIKSVKMTLIMTSGEKIELEGDEAKSLHDVMGSNRFHFHTLPNAKAEAKRKKQAEENAKKQAAENKKREDAAHNPDEEL